MYEDNVVAGFDVPKSTTLWMYVVRGLWFMGLLDTNFRFMVPKELEYRGSEFMVPKELEYARPGG